ncbi:MAG: hypothetical protein ACXQTP_00545 [Candidatus Methanofastidiosia archaeon]
MVPITGNDSFILSVGGGNFGSKAAILAKKWGAVNIVIDCRSNCSACEIADIIVEDVDDLDFYLQKKIQLLIADGIDALINILDIKTPDIVVPAINGHLAGRVAKHVLVSSGFIISGCNSALRKVLMNFPEEHVSLIDKTNSVMITSYMPEGMLCRENCNQPSICPVTKLEKGNPMHELLSNTIENKVDHLVLLHSRLLDNSGGVGGIIGKDVVAMLDYLKLIKTADNLAVATSCSCHGIVNFFHCEE